MNPGTMQISEYTFDASSIAVLWENGQRSEFAAIWLRDHCQGAECRNPDNGQRLMNITDFPSDVRIGGVEKVGNTLQVRFEPDSHDSVYSSDWLYANGYETSNVYDDRSESAKHLWRAANFTDAFNFFNYREFQTVETVKLEALNNVARYGFVILRQVPVDPGQVLKVIREFGYVRETNYGPLFEVRTAIDPNNLAYTSLGLGCHLDNPYRDPVPSLQLLHCLANSAEGGDSILQDGFMATKVLREENPAHFETLCDQWINFRFQDRNNVLAARAPMIECNDRGEVCKIRFNNRSIDTLRLPPDRLVDFYAAYRHFAEILERKSLQIEFKLSRGEVMIFDNTRILHARTAFSSSGKRHLQGAYSDLDGLYSTIHHLRQTLQG